MMRPRTAEEIRKSWATDPRWRGVERTYTAEDVVRLRGTLPIEHTLARRGAERLWNAMRSAPPVRALGALTGNQAIQQVAAGLGAVYVSGWQVAADANGAGQMYPDQSLYPADSVPALVRRINQALQRADQVEHLERLAGMAAGAGTAAGAGPAGGNGKGIGKGNGKGSGGRKATAASGGRNGGSSGNGANAKAARDWFVPIVADAEAGFGGDLNAFELMKAMIEAGAAGVHFEDQLASAKKCGHMGGKVLIPTREFIQRLAAARLAADLLDVPTLLVARTDADSARLLTSDIDERDRPFLAGERTPEGFHRFQGGQAAAIARGLAYAPHADVLWCETSTPDLDEARRFAEAVHARFPGKLLAYNCSPSFNWSKKLDPETIARFQTELGAMGYAFQFVTLAGFHALNLSMFELAAGYRSEAMTAYARLQDREFECQESLGYAAVKHQSFVGTGYFDEIARCLSAGRASTAALKDSTEAAQF